MEESPSPVADHYNELAEHWETIATGPGKEHILFPAVQTLLPDLNEKRILDAGCGDGLYSNWLAEQGGDVVGIDISERMIDVARERYGNNVSFECADLTEEIPAADESFDLIVCQHVFSHLPDLDDPLAEFARVLRPGGQLVLSTHHPFHDFLVTREKECPETYNALDPNLDPLVRTLQYPPQYHQTERFQIYWGGDEDGGEPGTYYRRPLSSLIQPLVHAGFDLRELTEPTPDETFRAGYPELAKELDQRPSRSICLRANLRGSD